MAALLFYLLGMLIFGAFHKGGYEGMAGDERGADQRLKPCWYSDRILLCAHFEAT